MADLEAVLADVSYLMAMEKSKCTPAARASKKICLPDPSVRSVMVKHLERTGEINFDKIFNQKIGYNQFKVRLKYTSTIRAVKFLNKWHNIQTLNGSSFGRVVLWTF